MAIIWIVKNSIISLILNEFILEKAKKRVLQKAGLI